MASAACAVGVAGVWAAGRAASVPPSAAAQTSSEVPRATGDAVFDDRMG